jgi:hypothetical protein
VLLAIVLFAMAPTPADQARGQGKQPDFIPAGYDDYQNMLDQLGIKKIRPGRNSKEKDTSNEATANPHKDTLPELMKFKDGTKVATADQWPKRRAEMVEDFERDVYGRIPKNVPKVTWKVVKTTEGESGGIATVTKDLEGEVDNSAFPKIKVVIKASFTVPKFAASKVPIIIQYGGFGGGKGGGPGVFLVPTAQAHNALRTLIFKKEMPGLTDQTQVFIDPIGHPTAPVVALNAYLHFAVLYKQSPVGLPVPNYLMNAKKGPKGDEKMNRKLQELAWELVTSYPASGVTADAKK